MFSMNEPGQYPPPDFGCPPQSSIQPFQYQQPPRSSNFHPSMWSWSETPSEPRWQYSGQYSGQYSDQYSGQYSWHQGEAAGFGFPSSGHGNYGPTRPYGQNFGHWGGHRGGRQHYGHPNNHRRKQKKEKEPEYSHFCDTCDQGFKTQEKYDEHISQHIKCSDPDCSFMAHEKIVSIHWKHNHAFGTRRIKLDTPEEIFKWREERRKNYPTLQNVEKKRKMMEFREETGAVLETAQFGRMRGRNRGRGRGQGRGRGNRGFYGQYTQGPRPSHTSATTEIPPPLTQRRNDGDPLGALASSDHDSDRDDTAAESRTGGLVVPPKQMSSALWSLMASYDSMSENDEEPEGEFDITVNPMQTRTHNPVPIRHSNPISTPIQRAKDLVQENQALLNPMPPNTQCGGPSGGSNSSSQSSEAHNVSQPVSVLHTPHRERGRAGRRGRRGRGGRRGQQDMPRARRPTLLEMLLAPDIRHERNVLLQCVRYVVRNNFFGLESRPQTQEGVKDEHTPAIPAEELEERQEKQSEEDEALKEDGRRSVGVDNQEDLDTNRAVLVDQNCLDQGLQSDQVCSLESRPQTQEGVKDEHTPAIPAEELEERKEKQSKEDEAVKEDGRRSVGVDNQEDLDTNRAVLVDQNCQDQGLQSDQVCSDHSEDPVGKRDAGELNRNGEETAAKDCHSSESTCSDEITRTLNVYDDEIWESPGAI